MRRVPHLAFDVRKDEEGSSLIDFLFLQFWARDGPDPLSSELKVLKKWLWAACVWPRPAPGPCALWYPRAARPQTRPLRIPLIALIKYTRVPSTNVMNSRDRASMPVCIHRATRATRIFSRFRSGRTSATVAHCSPTSRSRFSAARERGSS